MQTQTKARESRNGQDRARQGKFGERPSPRHFLLWEVVRRGLLSKLFAVFLYAKEAPQNLQDFGAKIGIQKSI